jgi:hypothetical protein
MSAVSSSTRQSPPTPSGRPDLAALRRRQRRAQAEAIVRGIARSQRGQPASRVQGLLAQALRSVRVRLSDRTLAELAAAISAGQPVTLP